MGIVVPPTSRSPREKAPMSLKFTSDVFPEHLTSELSSYRVFWFSFGISLWRSLWRDHKANLKPELHLNLSPVVICWILPLSLFFLVLKLKFSLSQILFSCLDFTDLYSFLDATEIFAKPSRHVLWLPCFLLTQNPSDFVIALCCKLLLH